MRLHRSHLFVGSPAQLRYVLAKQVQRRTKKTSTYIGYTVNPLKRIRQHNREIKGGAAKTGRRDAQWDMVICVFGFPNNLAVRFFD
jgi:predicted GIY-YIG superfamily endonuclease